MQFSVMFSDLLLGFSVVNRLARSWIGSAFKSALLMLVFLKAPFSVLLFSCFALITFQVLSVIMLPMLITLLSNLNRIPFLVSLLNFSLAFETVWIRV